MKALTLWQPWASLLAHGKKTIETRSWRGPMVVNQWIAIHAAKRWRQDQARTFRRRFYREDCAELFGRTDNLFGPGIAKPPLGAMVGLGYYTGCRPTEELREEISERELAYGDYSDGRWGWEFRELAPIEAIPCRGHQRLWDVPDHMMAKLEAGGS